MSQSLSQLAKHAGVTPANEQLRKELAQRLLGLAAGGLGLGAGARSLMELRNMMQPSVNIPFVSPGPSTLPVPVLQAKEEQPEPLDGTPSLFKAAEEPGMLNQVRDWIASKIPTSIPLDPLGVSSTATQYLSENVTEPSALPAALPLSVATGAAALGGGYALSDWMFRKRREQQLRSQLDQAKAQYQQALVEQHMAGKQAAAPGPYDRLDELYDHVEKQASLTNTAGKASGLYLALLGLTAAASGAGTYNWAKNRSQTALTNKAMKERSRQLWSRSPQPVYAVPQPIAIPAHPAV